MQGEFLSIETAQKVAKAEKLQKIIDEAKECVKESIESIKEYDIDRPIYSGEGVIDCLNIILEKLEEQK